MDKLKTEKYKIIFLDLWGTLIFDNLHDINVMRACVFNKYFKKTPDYWLNKINVNISNYQEFEMKGISKSSYERIKEILCGEAFNESDLIILQHELDKIYLNNIDKISINHKLDFLFDNNKEIYLISNSGLLSSSATLELLKKLKLYKMFKKIYLSENFPYCKPSVEFFKIPVEEFNLRNEEILMIGDSLEKDIMPCKKLNIDTYWIKND